MDGTEEATGTDDALQFLSRSDTLADEQELRRLFHRIAKAAAEAIVVTEPQLERPGPRILWVNEAFTAITGYGREEVLGKTPRILQGPKTDPSVLRRLRRRLAAGDEFEGETVNYRKDGTPYVNHWSIVPIQDEDDEILYWVSIQRDVTEKRQLEQEVIRTLDEERRRVGRDLHDSVGALVTAAKMRLENVMSQANLADDREEDLKKVRSDIEKVYDSLRRISQGLSPVDLSEGSLVQGLRRLASVTPKCTFEPEIALDDALSHLSTENVANLYWIAYEAVTNARRHADAEQIQVRAYEADESDADVLLVVQDDGVGFDVSAERADAWGLRLMKYRADLIGATVAVTSRSGEGTRVECRIPT